MTADFFVLGHFDQNKENKKWDELDKRGSTVTRSSLDLAIACH